MKWIVNSDREVLMLIKMNCYLQTKSADIFFWRKDGLVWATLLVWQKIHVPVTVYIFIAEVIRACLHTLRENLLQKD